MIIDSLKNGAKDFLFSLIVIAHVIFIAIWGQ